MEFDKILTFFKKTPGALGDNFKTWIVEWTE